MRSKCDGGMKASVACHVTVV